MSNDRNSGPVGREQDTAAKVSRRHLFRHFAVAGAGVALVVGSASPAVAKMSQKDAGYREEPKGDQSCSTCSMFSAPASCSLVDGAINPQGWCRYHQNKG